jgi:hypothetical protein
MTKYLLKIFFGGNMYALKSISMNQTVNQQRFSKICGFNTHQKILFRVIHFIWPGSGSGHRRPDPDLTEKARIRLDLDPQLRTH